MMTERGLIKNRQNIDFPEEVIYTSSALDYFITQDTTGALFLYGSRKRELTRFLCPGIKTVISVETGLFINTSDTFNNIKDIFDLKNDEIYYVLQLHDNNNQYKPIVLMFNTVEDCLNTQGFLTYLSTELKLAYLKKN